MLDTDLRRALLASLDHRSTPSPDKSQEVPRSEDERAPGSEECRDESRTRPQRPTDRGSEDESREAPGAHRAPGSEECRDESRTRPQRPTEPYSEYGDRGSRTAAAIRRIAEAFPLPDLPDLIVALDDLRALPPHALAARFEAHGVPLKSSGDLALLILALHDRLDAGSDPQARLKRAASLGRSLSHQLNAATGQLKDALARLTELEEALEQTALGLHEALLPQGTLSCRVERAALPALAPALALGIELTPEKLTLRLEQDEQARLALVATRKVERQLEARGWRFWQTPKVKERLLLKTQVVLSKGDYPEVWDVRPLSLKAWLAEVASALTQAPERTHPALKLLPVLLALPDLTSQALALKAKVVSEAVANALQR